MILKMLFKLYKMLNDINNRVKLAYYKNLWKKQFDCTSDFRIDASFNLDIQSGEARVILKRKVAFRKYCNIVCSNIGVLEIGNGVFFNNYCSINCLNKISIGDNTIFGEAVKLYDHNHLFKETDKLIKEQGMKLGIINIGSNCWIGSNTVILPNVVIGDNVVIGANNLIYKSVPNNTIVMDQSEKLLKAY